VSPKEFSFALELSDEPDFDAMLSDLTAAVLAFLGYSRAAAEELGGALDRALRDSRSKGVPRCEIRFRAHAGELQIIVSRPDGGWRAARPLP
jgi:hypothetical protein